MMEAQPFPIFDAHLHFSQAYLDQGLASLDQCGVRGGISLWAAGLGYATFAFDFAEFLRLLRARTGNRFVSFYWPDWTQFGWDSDRFVDTLCRDMERYAPRTGLAHGGVPALDHRRAPSRSGPQVRTTVPHAPDTSGDPGASATGCSLGPTIPCPSSVRPITPGPWQTSMNPGGASCGRWILMKRLFAS